LGIIGGAQELHRQAIFLYLKHDLAIGFYIHLYIREGNFIIASLEFSDYHLVVSKSARRELLNRIIYRSLPAAEIVVGHCRILICVFEGCVSKSSACGVVAPHIVIYAQHTLPLTRFGLEGEHQECIIFISPKDLFLGYKGTPSRAHVYGRDGSAHIAVVKA